LTRALVFSVNDSYALPLQVLLHSLHHTDSVPHGLPVFILHGASLSPTTMAALDTTFHGFGHPTRFIDVSPVVPADLPIRPGDHVTPETFFRLYSTGLLPPDLDQAVYLDADLLAIREVRALFSATLTHPLAAVDHLSPADQLRVHGPTGGTYFQAGVLLLDLHRWRTMAIEARFRDILERDRDRIRWWDQDVLNIALANDWQRLPVWYNVTEAVLHHAPPDEVAANARLIHFAGSAKPWTSNRPHPYRDAWDEAYHLALGMAYVRKDRRATLLHRVGRRLHRLGGALGSPRGGVR
jgi:lipopolysaccharide biosynthesis glycosyltransferase